MSGVDYKNMKEPVAGDPDFSEYWKNALEGRIASTPMGGVELGYYKFKNGLTWGGVMIRKDPGSPNGIQVIRSTPRDGGGKALSKYVFDLNDREQLWSWCAKRATTKTLFYEFFYTSVWRDVGETAPLSNLPADPFEALRVQIAAEVENANALLKSFDGEPCPDQEAADRATNIWKKLSGFLGEAEKSRKVEKDHWLRGGQAVDVKYKALGQPAGGPMEKLQAFFKGFQIAEQKRLNAIAAAEAERRRQQADVDRKAAEALAAQYAKQYPGVVIAPVDIPAPAPVVTQKARTGGAFGAKASLRKEYKAVRFNARLALQHYADHPDIVAAMDALAAKLAKEGKEKAFVWGYRIMNELNEMVSDGVTEPKEAA